MVVRVYFEDINSIFLNGCVAKKINITYNSDMMDFITVI